MRLPSMVLLLTCLALCSGGAQAQGCTSIPVCTLKTFNPDPLGPDASGSPACDRTNPPSSTHTAAFQAAWALAPDKVKADLCRITQFFIEPNTPGRSWGRWENPIFHTSIPGATQIVVNVGDLGKTFSEIQDNRLLSLNVSLNLGSHSESVPGSVDAKAVGLLYVLTHELGHIRWHKEFFIGELPDCLDDPSFYSWNTFTSTPDATRRWTNFNDDFGSHKDTTIKKPRDIQNADDLKKIYNNGLVTALGAANPEEDFVESYAVKALIEACNGCKFEIEI